jgi:hypothetical protein
MQKLATQLTVKHVTLSRQNWLSGMQNLLHFTLLTINAMPACCSSGIKLTWSVLGCHMHAREGWPSINNPAPYSLNTTGCGN